MVNGVTLLIFILMLETDKTVKEVNYVIIKMLMKYFSGSRNRISQANSPCHKCMKQAQLSKDRLKVAQVIVFTQIGFS